MYPEEMMGIDDGEVRQDLEGNLYQWEEGVDGLGNPIGFWKLFRRGGRAAGGALSTAAPATGGALSTIAPLAASMIPGAGMLPAVGSAISSLLGETQEGPDGQLYQWEEGVDGLGNPIGFWRVIRGRAGRPGRRRGLAARRRRAFRRFLSRVLPAVAPAAGAPSAFMPPEDDEALPPEAGPSEGGEALPSEAAAAEEGQKGWGEIQEGPDGQLYQWEEGIDGFGNPIGFVRRVRKVYGPAGHLRSKTVTRRPGSGYGRPGPWGGHSLWSRSRPSWRPRTPYQRFQRHPVMFSREHPAHAYNFRHPGYYRHSGY